MTPTFTASPSATASPTVTPAVGQGSWSFVPSKALPLITGDQGVSALITYKAGATAWPSSGGLLTLFFPAGFGTPGATSFFAAPAYASKIQSYSFSGLTVEVQVKDLAAFASLPFYYGYNATGVSVASTTSPLDFGVAAYVDSTTGGLGAVVTPDAAQLALVVQTPSQTATVTPTFTISATASETPTITTTFTITETFTETPIGVEIANSVYSYPNPFDLKKFNKCTFRFPVAANAQVTVFNLVGEPVREIPSSDINAAQGWAIWNGVDDYTRKVTGGLYFVRVKTPGNTVVKKFTVLY